MKKIVLFRPKTSPDYDYLGLPLSLLGLASLLEKDYEIKIVDAPVDRDYLEKVMNSIEGALCLGISTMTGYQISEGLEVAKAVKEKHPDIPIIWGGFHPTIFPEQTIQSDYVDIVVRGWGITTFKELVDALANNKPLENIQGITFVQDGKIISTPDRPFEDINAFPRFPFHLIDDMNRYVANTEFASRSISYVSSYGCPFRCAFCAENKVSKRRWSGLKPERVVDDIEYLVKNYGINGIAFVDNNFFVDEERVRGICKLLIERNLNIKWGFAEGRAEQLVRYEEDTWELMIKSGCA